MGDLTREGEHGFRCKDKSRSRATGGTGFEFAIAKQLVEAQGGTIEATNLPEGGLQVVIALKK